MIEAVVFDLDGVLVDTEELWASAREQLARERGDGYPPEATREMMGMSSPEWSRYMRDSLGVDMTPEEISDAVVARLVELYRERVPVIAGAREAVAASAERWRLGLASSANRRIIDLALELTKMTPLFAATISSEEVARGKPAPDVYIEAARRLDVTPERCAAVEDSSNGLRSAAAAGMTVVAVPNPAFPPEPDALKLAATVLDSIKELPAALAQLAEAA
jgi:HAD superfamily hydrolase (TIGR01509 family)